MAGLQGLDTVGIDVESDDPALPAKGDCDRQADITQPRDRYAPAMIHQLVRIAWMLQGSGL